MPTLFILHKGKRLANEVDGKNFIPGTNNMILQPLIANTNVGRRIASPIKGNSMNNQEYGFGGMARRIAEEISSDTPSETPNVTPSETPSVSESDNETEEEDGLKNNTDSSEDDSEQLQQQIKELDQIAATINEENNIIEKDDNNDKNNSLFKSDFGSFENEYDPNSETNVININFDGLGSKNTQSEQQQNIRKTSEFGGFIEIPQPRNATPYPQPSQTQQPQVQYYQMSNKRSQNQNENEMVGAPGFFANPLN